MYKGLYIKTVEWANSRPGGSVSDVYFAKIRLGRFKAVYSNNIYHVHTKIMNYAFFLLMVLWKC